MNTSAHPTAHPSFPRSFTARRRRLTIALAAAAVGLSLVTSACQFSVGKSADASPDRPTTTTTPTTTSTPNGTTTTGSTTAGGDGLEAVASSTVQIVSQGTFVDPEFGEYESAGAGSGFVIDPSGIAVTNNHVVAGAGLIQVYVPGEDKPRNAKILGVSECSDLAVIDIEGRNLPALEWYRGTVTPGLGVFAAGYPLGEPQYTLTSGIISKADANGETGWASVDHVLEQDAAIQPGNSGGPLVTVDGDVVGINYATWTRTNTDQFLAIDSHDAEPVIAELAAGHDVDSLGINGTTVTNEDGSLVGVWVSGVTSGSPADEAGVEPGDIITRLEGVSVGTDGTMSDYCDVIRTHDADDVLSVEVVRYATQEVLTGQINGEYLSPTFSFAETYDDVAADAPDYADYVTITDDSGTLSVSVPAEWTDVDGAPIDLAGVSSPSISASTDIAGFEASWDIPGMQFVASDALATYTADELLDLGAMTECESLGREPYDDGMFTGVFETYANCGGTATSTIVVAAFPPDSSYGVVVVVQIVSDADLAALDEILRSFYVTV